MSTSQLPYNQSNTPPEANSTSLPVEPLLERVDSLLGTLADAFDERSPQEELLATLQQSLVEMRETVLEQSQKITQMQAQSDAMARAQADAIVHSVEIIDELEQTRQHLSDARLAAEQAAGDTRRLADTIFERTHDGVLVFDNQQCIACNDNSLRLLGYQREAMLGGWPAAFQTAVHEDNSSAHQDLCAMYAKAADHTVEMIEIKLERANGERFWAEITMSFFEMQDSGHVLVVVRDISSRKNFETELRRHRDFLDNIINAVPDQLSVKCSDHKLVVANEAFCNAHGFRREEVVGQDISARLAHGLGEQLREIESRLLSTGISPPTEHLLIQPDGSHSIVSVKRSIFQDEASGDQYIVEASRDITEDRLREDRLRLLASVFNGASEGVAILSLTGMVHEANPAFTQVVHAGESPVGKAFTETLTIEVEDFDNILQRVATGETWSGKATHRNDDLQERSYWLSLSPSTETDQGARRIIALVSDITEREKAQAKLRHQAMYDTLTGLPNRRYYRERLQELIEAYTTSNERIAICFLDLDDFKHVNDSAGHSTGDMLLKLASKRLQAAVGSHAFVARFGGDEFAILLTGNDAQPQEVDRILEELLVSFREPFYLESTEAVIGLSLGTTHFPKDGTDADILMSNADIAMYAAKSAGKNRMRSFTPGLQDVVQLRHHVQSKLRRAMADGEIQLNYQPKVDSITRLPVGSEALVRWQTSTGEFIPPCNFIPVAEQTGLILPLGEIVFEQAVLQACQWNGQGNSPLIAINISAHQLRHPRFVEQVLATLERTNSHADWFELEITEYAVMEDVSYAVSVINQLKQLGFRVAIDDFGTGYSSLSYLKSFPIDTLKIDLSFVRDVIWDSQSRAIVRSIAALGKGLGLNVVAEGVECEEQADILTEAGCDQLQGYYFGKPMNAAAYEQWLGTYRPIR